MAESNGPAAGSSEGFAGQHSAPLVLAAESQESAPSGLSEAYIDIVPPQEDHANVPNEPDGLRPISDRQKARLGPSRDVLSSDSAPPDASIDPNLRDLISRFLQGEHDLGEYIWSKVDETNTAEVLHEFGHNLGLRHEHKSPAHGRNAVMDVESALDLYRDPRGKDADGTRPEVCDLDARQRL